MSLKINNVEITSLEKRTGKVRMRLPFGSTYSINQPTPEVLAEVARLAASRASLQAGGEIPDLTFDQVNPQDSDFIYPLFRAISAAMISDYWLDFSGPGVLKASVPMLQGQTVYSDHVYWRVANWLGVVGQAVWDEKGDQVDGTPGINVELKIDWKMNPKIARGLLMKPPAIHSVSATVLFEWDASHPDLLDQHRFFSLLGEEVDGQIVRIIVTKVLGYWELSLVFQGADVRAKQLRSEDEDWDELGVRDEPEEIGPVRQIGRIKEKQTVKLSAEQKKKLGLEAHEGDDVPDAIVIGAAEGFATRATENATELDSLLGAARAECLRVATLAEGDKEGTLPEAIGDMINGASAKQLTGLTKMYAEKAAAKFDSTCQHCGTKQTVEGRSSVENPAVHQQEARVVDTGIL